ncbi:MAG TPA: hypothetical protein VL737_00080 [Candidatus Pristimantibacillus sp.]|nr:hypothetical protein [Candidatus Pristimantibacillus sp.]
MTEKALSVFGTGDIRRSGNVALVRTVHRGLDTVVAPDGRLIVGVSQEPGGSPRTLDLKGVVSDATDIVAQGGADARRSYGNVFVVVSRPDGQGGEVWQRVLIDYPSKRVITNPGEPNQHEYPADGLPQSFTTGQPYAFVPKGGDSSKPKTSNGSVVAAFMYGPPEESAVGNFDPTAIANGRFSTLTHAYFDPAKPMTPEGLQQAYLAEQDPIAMATAAAQKLLQQPPGGGAPGAIGS